MFRVGIARTTYLAYTLVLIAFVLLGTLVASLAYGKTGLAIAAAAGLAASLAASIAGFRAGGAQLARASEAAGHRLSVWVDPLQDNAVARYRTMYRGEGDVPAPPTDISTVRRVPDDRAAATSIRLSA